jgi:hypothetical protein
MESAGETVTTPTIQTTTSPPGVARDALVAALARYVEALHARYPEGPDQMRNECLDARGNMPRMCKSGRGRAA